MAWTAPPTFSDGAILSAAQLNILSDDLETLYGVTQGVVTPFSNIYSPGYALTVNNNGYYIRHRHRYLHYRARVIDYYVSFFRLTYHTTALVTDSNTRNGGYTYQGYVDLNPYGFTVGTWYKMYLETTVFTNFTLFALDYLLESDSSTL